MAPAASALVVAADGLEREEQQRNRKRHDAVSALPTAPLRGSTVAYAWYGMRCSLQPSTCFMRQKHYPAAANRPMLRRSNGLVGEDNTMA